ncbi:MAG: HAD-IB family phosphatase [Gammaproteobacteria bacterium]
MVASASPAAGAAVVAVFDLYGTLTYRDTFIPWLLGYTLRQPTHWWRLLGLVPIGFAAAVGVRDRGRLKSWLLRVLAGGSDSAALDCWSRDYAARVVATSIRPAAREALQRHLAAGDHVIVLSASVDAYVPRIAALLGVHETICTGVRWREDGRLDGRLTTPNRQGEEKALVLRALRERFAGCRFAAYGNTAGDLPHLRLADAPLLVNANGRARRQAVHLGIPTADWS